MKKTTNIFLVGPMGAGKTTIGRLLADRLQLHFVDADKYIEDATGANIPWIFDVEGEAGFRERETKAIDELSQDNGILLATGGGAVTREVNRDLLRQRGVVVYLYATVDQQVERTARDRNRPLLQNDNPRQVLESLFHVRDPLYREVADIIVTTDNRPPHIVARDIGEQISQYTSQLT
ncbi:MAG TPA: shikimate kinase AroK [Pseudomonadales bacterium]|nr:shikimate kinase AroK [Pseudomonadales bacterium]